MNSSFASFQSNTASALNAVQNDIANARQVYDRAFGSLSSDVRTAFEVQVKNVQDQIQTQCNSRINDVSKQFQDLTTRSTTERNQFNINLQTLTQQCTQRINDLTKQNQDAVERFRNELTTQSTNALNNQRQNYEGQLTSVRSEMQRQQQEFAKSRQDYESRLTTQNQNFETQRNNLQKQFNDAQTSLRNGYENTIRNLQTQLSNCH